MREIYLWQKDGNVFYHTSLDAAAKLDGLTAAPEKTVTEHEWDAAGGLARVVGGIITLDKTVAEKQAETNALRVNILKRALADTDYIAVKIAEGAATAQEYAAKLAERKAWRLEIQQLQSV